MVAGRFNTNNPAVLGNEWLVTDEGGYALNTDSAIIGAEFTAVGAGTEIIQYANIYLGGQTDPAGASIEATVYKGRGAAIASIGGPMGNLDYGTPGGEYLQLDGVGSDGLSVIQGDATGSILCRPTANVTQTNIGAGTFTDVDHMFMLSLIGLNQDNVFFDVFGTYGTGFTMAKSGKYEWRTSTGFLQRKLSGRRIRNVQHLVIAHSPAPAEFRIYLKMGGLIYQQIIHGAPDTMGVLDIGPPFGGGSPVNTGAPFVGQWDVNPATGRPWTIADVETFSTTNALGIRTTSASTSTIEVIAVLLVVNFEEENRLGFGVKTSPTVNAWNQVPLATPDYSANMLYADEASFESGTGGWAVATNCAIAQSASVTPPDGTKSLRLSSSAGGNMAARTTGSSPTVNPAPSALGVATPHIPVVVGTSYTASAAIRKDAAVGTGKASNIAIEWRDWDNAVLSTSTGADVTDSNTFQTITVTATAPANTRYASLLVTVKSTVGAAEFHYVDTVQLMKTGFAVGFVGGGAPGSGGFTKVAGDSIFITFRRVPSATAGGPCVNILDSGSPVPMPAANAYTVYLPTMFGPAGSLATADVSVTGAFGLVLEKAASAYSDDSFVYAKRASIEVYDTAKAQQYITAPVVGAYGFVSVVAALASDATVGGLLVRVKRQSDNVQIGADVTVLPSRLIAPRTNAQVLNIPLAQSLALSNVQYYLEFACPAAGSVGVGWNIFYLDTVDGQRNSLTFGGTTDTALITGFPAVNWDLEAFLATVPAAPNGFTVTTV